MEEDKKKKEEKKSWDYAEEIKKKRTQGGCKHSSPQNKQRQRRLKREHGDK